MLSCCVKTIDADVETVPVADDERPMPHLICDNWIQFRYYIVFSGLLTKGEDELPIDDDDRHKLTVRDVKRRIATHWMPGTPSKEAINGLTDSFQFHPAEDDDKQLFGEYMQKKTPAYREIEVFYYFEDRATGRPNYIGFFDITKWPSTYPLRPLRSGRERTNLPQPVEQRFLANFEAWEQFRAGVDDAIERRNREIEKMSYGDRITALAAEFEQASKDEREEMLRKLKAAIQIRLRFSQ